MGVQERKERERQGRLEAIRKAALKLFARDGYAQTTMDQVAEEAELAKGTIYYYFGSKAQLFEHVLEHYTERLFASLMARIRSEDTAAEAIENLMNGYLDFYEEFPDFFKLHVMWESDQAKGSGLQLEAFRKRYRDLRKPLDQALLSKLQKSPVPVDEEAVLVTVGGLMLMLSTQLTHGRPVESVRALVPKVAALLRRGIECP
ncbi:MAG: TetR/AcrR family transcriptional regulator [Calditrichaeota bacterium]|nr:TetR/AcrR family transcriptional regulator [Calditrichota bacterium]